MSNELRYRIIILIMHPKLTPDEISDSLKLDPDRSWCVGMPRQTPKGEPLPGVYKETRWSIWEIRVGERSFLDRVGSMLKRLERHRDFLQSISKTGGEVAMTVQLPGDVNIGDELSPYNLARLADLGIGLGIEVFPHMKPQVEETIWRDEP